MAKKKKGKRRRRPPSQRPNPGRTAARTAPAVETTETEPAPAGPPGRRPSGRDRQMRAQERRRQRQRRERLRNVAIASAVVLLVLAGIGFRVVQNRTGTARFERIAATAGCGDVKKTSASGEQQHLEQGQSTTYDTSPPTHGRHAQSILPARVYREPLSTDPNAQAATVYQAVHSLEHGYVIAWYKGLSDAEFDALDRAMRGEEKVIAVPYPELREGKLALTSWARLLTCEKADTKVVDAFIDRFREKTAPEPQGT